MWEFFGLAAGILVLMLLCAFLPHVFDVPEWLGKYFSKRLRQSKAGLASSDPDEAAAHLLGESLKRAGAAPETVAQVTAAFWAADAANRRSLAHMLAGMSADGPVEDEEILAVLPNLRTMPASTAIRESPGPCK